MSERRPRVLCNDDGWILGTYGPPITPEQLREHMVATYAQSPVDLFLWSVGGHEVFDFETDIGERVGDGYDELDEGGARRRDNIQHLVSQHGGPVTLISKLCHEAGMAFFPSVRMNEHYDIPEEAYNYGRFRRDHPEYLIGHPETEVKTGTQEWGIRTGINYACPEVRAYMLAIISELIDRFDIDGIELDFMRHPAFFRIEEAYASRYLATDLVRQVRQRLDEKGAREGRELDLAIRVPTTLADSSRIGLDAHAWIVEGLADILIAGGGFRPFEIPIREFVEAAAGTDCRVYGCLEALAGVLNEEKLRAICTRYWDAGVDGLYLFNYFNLSAEWKRDVLGALADPAALANLDKRYEVDYSSRERPNSQLGWSFRNAIPLAQLPVLFTPTVTDRAAALTLDIADEIEKALTAGTLKGATLALNFQQLADGSRMEVSLNDTLLSWDDAHRASNTWTETAYPGDWSKRPPTLVENPVEGDHAEFVLDPGILVKGENILKLRLIGEADEPLELKGVRLHLRYG